MSPVSSLGSTSRSTLHRHCFPLSVDANGTLPPRLHLGRLLGVASRGCPRQCTGGDVGTPATSMGVDRSCDGLGSSNGGGHDVAMKAIAMGTRVAVGVTVEEQQEQKVSPSRSVSSHHMGSSQWISPHREELVTVDLTSSW